MDQNNSLGETEAVIGGCLLFCGHAMSWSRMHFPPLLNLSKFLTVSLLPLYESLNLTRAAAYWTPPEVLRHL